nr:hypothetical protein [Klebsiella pneumoniae subsp. pneumoniae]
MGDRHYHHAGWGLSILKLPVAQYPTIAPPAIPLPPCTPVLTPKRCRTP